MVSEGDALTAFDTPAKFEDTTIGLRLRSARSRPLSPIRHASRQRHAHPLHRVGLAPQYFEDCVLALPPEADIKAPLPQPQIAQRHVWQPVRQRRIGIQLTAWRIL